MNESCAPALAAKRASEAAERATDVKERIVSGAWWYNSVRGYGAEGDLGRTRGKG